LICPECGTEFREGITVCSDCGIPLADEPPAERDEPEWTGLVTVLETSDFSLLLVAKSVLESAGIPYFAKGEGVQDLFGAGRIGSGFNPLVGPVQLQVPEERAQEAAVLLENLPPPETSQA